jgi:DNA polymerase-4
VIKPEQGLAFVSELAIGNFHGIGPATEAKMNNIGIVTGDDLRRWNEADLVAHFGKSGHHFYYISRGIDERAVQSKRQCKSVGKETTFQQDSREIQQLNRHISDLAEQAWAQLVKLKLTPRTLTLKVKYADFKQVTRSMTEEKVLDLEEVKRLLPELLSRTEAGDMAVRLVGVSLSGFDQAPPAVEDSQQLDLGLNDVF